MDFNKIKEMGLEYAEKGKNAALDLAEKGRTQAKIVNAQSKLYKAQRQLGALVYSLAKGSYNEVLVTDGKGSVRTVYVVPQFTIPDDKVLVIELFEKDGGRHQTVRVENADLVAAKQINELKIK